MAQTYYASKPAWADPPKRSIGTHVAANLEAIRSSFSGTSAPVSPAPVAGQPFFNENSKTPHVYDGSLWIPLPTSAVVTKTADYTLTLADSQVIANKATAMTLTLPAATGSGKAFTIKNIGAGNCTIDGNASETIDGETTQTLRQWAAVTIIDYASGAWVIV